MHSPGPARSPDDLGANTAKQDSVEQENVVLESVCAASGGSLSMLKVTGNHDDLSSSQDLNTPDTGHGSETPDAWLSSETPAAGDDLQPKSADADPRLMNPLVPLRLVESPAEAEAANRNDPNRVTVAIPHLYEILLAKDKDGVPFPYVSPIGQGMYSLSGRDLVLNLPNGSLKDPVKLRALELRALHLDSFSVKSVSVEVMPNDEAGNPQTLVDVISVHGPEHFLQLTKVAKPCFRKASGKKQKEYVFDPDPAGTRARFLYLQPEMQLRWRPSQLAPDAWSHWNGTHWQLLRGNHEVLVQLESSFERQGWANREPATMSGLISALRRNLPLQPRVAMEGLVPFANGCLELATQTLLPHDPGRGNTWSLPFAYNQNSPAQLIKEFLNDRFGDPALVELFRAFARALLARRRVKVILELFGPGNTGKTVVANLLMAAVGKANVVGLTLERLEKRSSRFETSRILGKCLIVVSESQGYSGPLENLKALTGGDLIPAEMKGRNELYDYVFNGGVLVVGNGPITCTDPTGAVVNRRRSIAITKVVRPEEQRQLLEESSDGVWSGAFVEELPGFVNWVLELSEDEAVSILTQDQMTPTRVETFKESLLSDPLVSWLEQCVILQLEGTARIGTKSDNKDEFLYPNYLNHIQEAGEPSKPVSLKEFKRKIVDLLRDTFNLPLPPGPLDTGSYKLRGTGSVIPQLRLRVSGGDASQEEDTPGIITTALKQRFASDAAAPKPEMDGLTPVE
jgi:P4 family phage/plasmid primase-like protien